MKSVILTCNTNYWLLDSHLLRLCDFPVISRQNNYYWASCVQMLEMSPVIKGIHLYLPPVFWAEFLSQCENISLFPSGFSGSDYDSHFRCTFAIKFFLKKKEFFGKENSSLEKCESQFGLKNQMEREMFSHCDKNSAQNVWGK